MAGLLALGLAAGCSCSAPEPTASEETPVSSSTQGDGIAATVHGVPIYESDVTAEIEAMREANDLGDAERWSDFLDAMGYEPATVREQVITRRIDEELVAWEVAARSLDITDEQLEAAFAAEKARYGSDENFQNYLNSYHLTEDEFKATLKATLQSQALQSALLTSSISDEDRLARARTIVDSYDGAKRVSIIVFGPDERDLAASVKGQIESGALSFADAAAQYSQDSSKAEGGDKGWDVLSVGKLSPQVFAAVASLNSGQISDVIETANGPMLVTVTDVFQKPAELTSLDELPAEFRDAIDRSLIGTTGAEKLAQWIAEQKAQGDVVWIAPMPEDLPYRRS